MSSLRVRAAIDEEAYALSAVATSPPPPGRSA